MHSQKSTNDYVTLEEEDDVMDCIQPIEVRENMSMNLPEATQDGMNNKAVEEVNRPSTVSNSGEVEMKERKESKHFDFLDKEINVSCITYDDNFEKNKNNLIKLEMDGSSYESYFRCHHPFMKNETDIVGYKLDLENRAVYSGGKGPKIESKIYSIHDGVKGKTTKIGNAGEKVFMEGKSCMEAFESSRSRVYKACSEKNWSDQKLSSSQWQQYVLENWEELMFHKPGDFKTDNKKILRSETNFANQKKREVVVFQKREESYLLKNVDLRVESELMHFRKVYFGKKLSGNKNFPSCFNGRQKIKDGNSMQLTNLRNTEINSSPTVLQTFLDFFNSEFIIRKKSKNIFLEKNTRCLMSLDKSLSLRPYARRETDGTSTFGDNFMRNILTRLRTILKSVNENTLSIRICYRNSDSHGAASLYFSDLKSSSSNNLIIQKQPTVTLLDIEINNEFIWNTFRNFLSKKTGLDVEDCKSGVVFSFQLNKSFSESQMLKAFEKNSNKTEYTVVPSQFSDVVVEQRNENENFDKRKMSKDGFIGCFENHRHVFSRKKTPNKNETSFFNPQESLCDIDHFYLKDNIEGTESRDSRKKERLERKYIILSLSKLLLSHDKAENGKNIARENFNGTQHNSFESNKTIQHDADAVQSIATCKDREKNAVKNNKKVSKRSKSSTMIFSVLKKLKIKTKKTEMKEVKQSKLECKNKIGCGVMESGKILLKNKNEDVSRNIRDCGDCSTSVKNHTSAVIDYEKNTQVRMTKDGVKGIENLNFQGKELILLQDVEECQKKFANEKEKVVEKDKGDFQCQTKKNSDKNLDLNEVDNGKEINLDNKRKFGWFWKLRKVHKNGFFKK